MTLLRSALHFALLYHRAIRVPVAVISLALLAPVYNRGLYVLPTLLTVKVVLTVALITINHRRSPNYVAFFLNMQQAPTTLWATYLAVDIALYSLLAALTLGLR